eukprot:gnl/Dysnectes_brevis/2997_a3697_1213.p1 GENE.gnl/Dysnectes_brevis/2997_a3697_1213~~gnl/Dysnectes_brevis/2997_a3697_1213.p1  ORF type:complete len:759 (+),score=265.50 gnl/Dysnectes_brevis/2997_a3697_1213:155-2431(+)
METFNDDAEIVRRNNLELRYKAILTELIVYIVFLLLFTLFVLSNLQKGAFYSTSTFTHQFSSEWFGDGSFNTFEDIASMDEWFQWLEGPFIKAMYPETLYDGTSTTDAWFPSDTAFHSVLGTSTSLLGRVRIRQLRVDADTCDFEDSMDDYCYADHLIGEDGVGSGLHFRPSKRTPNEETDTLRGIWTWTDSTASISSFSAWRQRYPGSGYSVDLPMDRAGALEVISQLKEDFFLDRQTRQVLVEINMVNPMTNLFMISRLSLEPSAFGSTTPYSRMLTSSLLHYSGAKTTEVLLDIGLIVAVFYFLCEELGELWELGFQAYRQDAWNVIDLSNLVFFAVGFYFRFRSAIESFSVVSKLDLAEPLDEFVNMWPAAAYSEWEKTINAVNCLIVYLKLFKSLRIFPSMQVVVRSITKAAKDLAIFLVIILVFLVGAAGTGILVFGSSVKGFRSIPLAMYKAIEMLMGGVDFNELYDSNRYFGPAFYIVFMTLGVLGLSNMFISILTDAYETVQDQVKCVETTAGDGIFFKQGDFRWLNRRVILALRDRLIRIFPMGRKDSSEDGSGFSLSFREKQEMSTFRWPDALCDIYRDLTLVDEQLRDPALGWLIPKRHRCRKLFDHLTSGRSFVFVIPEWEVSYRVNMRNYHQLALEVKTILDDLVSHGQPALQKEYIRSLSGTARSLSSVIDAHLLCGAFRSTQFLLCKSLQDTPSEERFESKITLRSQFLMEAAIQVTTRPESLAVSRPHLSIRLQKFTLRPI